MCVQALEEHRDDLGEPFLASCFAYLQKASEDNLGEIVFLIQRILQMYAARQWSQVDADGQHDALLQDVLTSDPQNWESMIRGLATSGVTPYRYCTPFTPSEVGLTAAFPWAAFTGLPYNCICITTVCEVRSDAHVHNCKWQFVRRIVFCRRIARNSFHGISATEDGTNTVVNEVGKLQPASAGRVFEGGRG